MKHILVILTISCILSKDVYQFSWDVWFTIHQKEVAEKLCENKANPLLNCNGQCYLSKQLKKAVVELEKDLKDSSSSRTKIMNEVKIIEFKKLDFSINETVISSHQIAFFNRTSKDWNYQFIQQIEHPPTA